MIGDTGHKLINHVGVEIRVTAKTLRELKFRGLLRRKRKLPAFKSELFPFLGLLDREAGLELGPDIAGSEFLDCGCLKCKPESFSEELEMLTTEQIAEFDRKQWQRNMPFVIMDDWQWMAMEKRDYGKAPWSWMPTQEKRKA